MYERIVVGTDGSPEALDAVHRAGELAAVGGVPTIHLVSAARPFSDADLARIAAELPAEFRDVVGTHLPAHDRFDAAADVLAPMEVGFVPHDVAGDAATVILDLADEVDADLIVVGSRRLGAVGRLVRGSVSTRIAQHAACDVLVVEHDDPRPLRPPRRSEENDWCLGEMTESSLVASDPHST